MRIMVFGTFDQLHPGHQSFLSQAYARGELWVVVARDSSVLNIKKRSPVQTEDQRMKAIAAAFPRAHVMLGNADGDFLAPVRAVRPDLIMLGYDQKMPPGVTESELGAATERADAFHPEKYKSSLLREIKN